MFVYIWEYFVPPAHVEEFREHYGPAGSWVELFRRSRGYRGTRLIRDRTDPSRFVTIDSWASADAHSTFLEDHDDEYKQLDAACERLTSAESLIGYFESLEESESDAG